MTIEEAVRHAVREEVKDAVREALEEAREPPGTDPPESWQSRLHRVHPETRLSLSETAEALDVSERTVRRHLNGEKDTPDLPHQRGPRGITVTAGDLRQWIDDVEQGNRFGGGGGVSDHNDTIMDSTSVGYLYVPSDVMSSTDLGLREKAMWGRVEAFADGNGICRESNNRLGHQLNLSKRQVQRLLKNLEEQNYLRREFKRDEKGQIVERRLVPTLPDRDSDSVTTPMTDPESRKIDGNPRANGENPETTGIPILSSRSLYNTQEQLDGLSEEERAIMAVWGHYLSRYAHRYSESRAERLKLDACGRKGHLRARLKEGYSPEELCRAIDGNFGDDWHRGRDKHELEYIVRNQSKVEKFLSIAHRNGGPPEEGQSQDGRAELEALRQGASGE